MRRGFDEYFGLPYSNDQWPLHPEKPGDFPPLPLIEGERGRQAGHLPRDMEQLTTWYTERAIRFIERNKDRPFFLYVAHTMPHVPLAVSERFRGTTQRGPVRGCRRGDRLEHGEILAALKRHGLERDTLVMFLSDNGPWLVVRQSRRLGDPAPRGEDDDLGRGHARPLHRQVAGAHPGGRRLPRDGDVDRPAADGRPAHRREAARPPDRRPRHLAPPRRRGGREEPARGLFLLRHPVRRVERRGARIGPQRDWKLILPHAYRTLGGHKPGMDGWPGEYLKRTLAEPELYDMAHDIGETNDVASGTRRSCGGYSSWPSVAAPTWATRPSIARAPACGSRGRCAVSRETCRASDQFAAEWHYVKGRSPDRL